MQFTIDINFEDNTIKLYSKYSYDITKSEPQLLRDVFVYMSIFCAMLGFGFLVFCQKKKPSEINPWEKLTELVLKNKKINLYYLYYFI